MGLQLKPTVLPLGFGKNLGEPEVNKRQDMEPGVLVVQAEGSRKTAPLSDFLLSTLILEWREATRSSQGFSSTDTEAIPWRLMVWGVFIHLCHLASTL